MIAALADARREVQRELETSTDRRDQELAALGEWAIVTVLAAAPEVRVLDPDHTRPGAPPPDPRRRRAGRPRAVVFRRPPGRAAPLARRTTSGCPGGHRRLRDRRDRQDHPGRRGHRPRPGPRARPDPGQPDRAADPGNPARRGDFTIRRELLVRGQARPGPGRAGRPIWAGRTGWRSSATTSWTGCRCLLSGQLRRQPRPDGDGTRSATRCWPGCWPPGSATGPSRLLVTCRYPFTLPGGAERRCRSGSWGRCPRPRP